jgi:NADH/F420H2 dehydrogenase subunit C
VSVHPSADPESKVTTVRLRQALPHAVLATAEHRGDLSIRVERAAIRDVLAALRDDPETRYDMLTDLAGVDWLGQEPRFEVVYHLYSISKKHRARIRIGVPEDDPVVDSVVSVYRGADWFERECYDLLGILFRGHPFLRRILTHDEFQGHALRKDYDQLQRWRCTRVSDLESTVEVPGAGPAVAPREPSPGTGTRS